MRLRVGGRRRHGLRHHGGIRPGGRILTRLRPLVRALEERTLLSSVPTVWAPRGPGGGGALYSPAISPTNAGEIYIASDMGELFHTTNSGASWSEIDFRQIQSSHETRVEFTENPSILYSIDYTDPTGSGTSAPTESTDGGQTWHPLANDPTGAGAIRLFADPSNHNRILVSDYDDLYFSNNGGSSWSTAYTNDNGGQGLHIAGAFFSGSNIYVGTNSGLLVSSDGGTTFALSSIGGIPAGSAMISFAGAQQGGTTRFFAVTWGSADVDAGVQGYDYSGIAAGSQGVYTLTVGQSSWTQAMTGITSSVVPIYVGMALNDVSTAYVAGGSNPSGAPTVYKTTDGGAHWRSVLLTSNNQNIATGWQGAGGDRGWGYGEVALGFTVARYNSNEAVITDEGFTHETTNGGTSWQQLYVVPADQNSAGSPILKGKTYQESGLDNTSAWGINWVDANDLIVSSTDITGSHSADGGNSFAFATSGNNYNTTYMTVTAPGTGLVYAATSSVHDMYQSTHLTDASIDGGTGAVLVSADKGTTWQTLHNFGKPVVWVATDPTGANRLYASVVNSSAGGIYVTNDLQDGASSAWTKLTNPPRTQGHPFDIRVLNDGTLVVSYSGRRAGSPQNFTNSSGVFVSTDGGQTWSDRSDPSMLYWTTDVVIDPSDPSQNTWYAGVFDGWGGASNNLGGLYRTTDRGLHWTQISNLPRVSSVTINPNDPNEAFLTTETQGLWYSSNIQSASPTFTQVASYPFRQPERVFYNPYNPNQIWVTSFGSGLYVGSTSTLTAPTVTWTQPTAITYGTPLGPAQLDASANIPGTFTYTPAANALLGAGNGQTLWVTFNPTDTADYSSVTQSTTINVLKAHLTVTAANLARPRRAANPPLTYTLTGFVNGDTASSVSGTPALSTTAVKSSTDGSYPITVGLGTLSAANYDFPTLNNGTLTVTGSSAAQVGDYDGDGKTDLAVFRPGTDQWVIHDSSGGVVVTPFGDTSQQDIPAPGDYEGIGRTDLAVFRPGTDQWIILLSTGAVRVVQFGDPTQHDLPVPGDYDGDGKTDLALFRPATDQWIIQYSGGGSRVVQMGDPASGDLPVPSDYDGDGKTDLAIFRTSTAQWIIHDSSGGSLVTQFGDPTAHDLPAWPSAVIEARASSTAAAASSSKAEVGGGALQGGAVVYVAPSPNPSTDTTPNLAAAAPSPRRGQEHVWLSALNALVTSNGADGPRA
jgi:photosystem II stability/assembly factor-like uncharacterized protein